MPTGKEMCETIVRAMRKSGAFEETNIPTPEALWQSSPSGELWHIFELYEWAKKVLAEEFPDTQEIR